VANPDIDILLATYNGARFLEAQIESLLRQEDVPFRILVRDDGSTDGTLAIIDGYRRTKPDRFLVLNSSGKNLGAAGNFAALLAHSNAPHVALSDQDDVWVPHKLRVLSGTLREMENRHGPETPLLVCSDLYVVDEDLRMRHPSYWRYAGLNPSHTSLSRLLIRNPAAGCASLFNRALAQLSLPLPREALVHDHWLTLVAAAAGHIGIIREPLVYYRQHSVNIIGARPYDWRAVVRRLRSGANWDIGALQKQAAALLERCQSILAPKDQALIEDFVSLPDRHWIVRRWLLLRHSILMPGLLRNLALLFWVRLRR
jgi:glycosyltransferase involved in cell wall biosynthesis